VGSNPGVIYIDGVAVAPTTNTFNGLADNASDEVYIGLTPGGEDTANFDGLLDDVALLSVVLTPAEVQSLMMGNTSITYTNSP
jgi:hypothetical protein